MNKLLKNPECKQGVVVIIGALIFLAMIPWQVPDATRTWGVTHALPGGHKMFPYMSILAILLGGVVLWFDGFRKPAQEKEKAENQDYAGFWVSVATWAVYAVMVTYIGYIVSTFIILVFLLRYYGLKSWIKTALITVGVTAFIYIVFVMVMKIPFPRTALLF